MSVAFAATKASCATFGVAAAYRSMRVFMIGFWDCETDYSAAHSLRGGLILSGFAI
jgi:hypothetical protein